ncbi:unnamed protein product, partial [marine sediment metagenome]
EEAATNDNLTAPRKQSIGKKSLTVLKMQSTAT